MGSRASALHKGTHHQNGHICIFTHFSSKERDAIMNCVSGKMEPARARSEERGDGATSGSGGNGRRPSLPGHNQARGAGGWSAHYSTGRKFSRTHGNSVLPNHSHPQNAPRLPRHPELPPLNSTSPSGPRLEEYLEKPRLVSTVGRKSSAAGNDAPDPLSQQLARLSNYYNQTFLNSYSTYDSMSHKNPVGVLSNNRDMFTFSHVHMLGCSPTTE